MLVLQKDCSLGKGFLFQWSFFKLVDDWTSLAFNCKIIVDKYWRFIGSLYIGLQNNFDAGFNTESCTHEQLQERQARLSLLSSLSLMKMNTHEQLQERQARSFFFTWFHFFSKLMLLFSFKMHIFSFVWLNFEMFTFVLKLQFLTFINFWFNVIIDIRYSSSEIWKWRHWFVQFWYFSGWICSLYGRGKQPGEGKYSRNIGVWSLQNTGQNQECLGTFGRNV